MRVTNIILLSFVLMAFSIGAGLQEVNKETIDIALENVSTTIENITLNKQYFEEGKFTSLNGLFKILEKYIHFVGSIFIESARAGIHFGQENPEYFEPSFIVQILRLLVIAMLVSLLIKPAFYILIFFLMAVLWISDKIKSRRAKRNEMPINCL